MIENPVAQWRMFLHEVAGRTSRADRWDFAYREKISFFGPHLKMDARVLDVGCGEGVLSLFLGYLGCQVLAIDQSGYQIAQNAALSAKAGLTGVRFRAVEFDDLGYEVDEPYDIVICTDVLEHFGDPDSATRRVVRFMKDEGELFLSLPSPAAPVHRMRKRLLGYDPFDRMVGHNRRFTVMELRELVNGAGLTLVEIREVEGFLKNLFFVTGIGRYLQRFNRWAFKELLISLDQVMLRSFGGAGHYAVARKSPE